MYDVRSNVHALVKELEKRRGEDYEKQRLAQMIGITRPTLDALLVPERKRQRIEYSTMGKLLKFFRHAGLQVTLDDLFVVADNGH
jgi:DNA-binding XRE family transcriptional regulator